LKDKIKKAYLLANKNKLIVTHENGKAIILAPDDTPLDPINTVVVLEIKGKIKLRGETKTK
jgi:hypothetical protein